ncbi:MetQ/NlpA family ABC transporter substrate-binding protein [Corynebacterium genitalium ATCC 33030]|uniref:NLPA lipoprotein n=1 Tax=Corynebacterium genitalium ATCC 33030 TaxID=585529 RepID=D7WBQ7_9CORY|nr:MULTISPECIES: MetQ/NlpA family ABC transporter substrate-binding protein [Corynebacterium]MCQ4619528.1 metal ABC transporter substrate-binding protein [Corynebacterium pseudogenitalium]EFK55288.1 NLPA lipoprotein [Corynebacterium genitalium ATCC 33030]MCQ4620015.1 metal ABC transporter substrate-binding protein [Corynebacterium sp. CCUG 71335]MCQ4622976.1 metal ABC transporter substrate-binding protein [Corynebacterium sp. CCUG 70398]MCQ4624406.1 metal ABC transporter substrate-binding prot
MFKKIAAAVAAGSLVLGLTACGSSESTDAGDDKTIRVATSPGPYSELFQDGVAPILEEEGYTVDVQNFTDLTQADTALAEGSADLNVEQHTAWMNVFNEEKGANLTSITEVPTVPAGLYSEKHKSLDEVADGQTVGIPLDGSNKSRALHVLVDAGWITLRDDADETLLAESDIDENPHNLEIKPMDSANLSRSLPDLDWAVIPGSMSYSAKLDPNLQVFQEELRPELILVAVTTEDKKDAPWANAVAEAYRSDEFKEFFDSQNENDYWFLPDSLK